MTDWTGIAAVIAPITTLAGVLGGYWLAGRNEEARDSRVVKREVTARRAVLADQLEEERHTIYRDTLLALQDELQALLLATAADLLELQRTLSETAKLSPGPGRNQDHNRIRANVSRLQARVLDEGLRAALAEFLDFCARSTTAMDLGMRLPYDSVLNTATAQEALGWLQSRAVELASRYEGTADKVGIELRREFDRRYLAVGSLDGSA